ncbi:uncharacterized protein F5891DRAFT_1193331 [Suillus fuscotomentosus]|uniref:Uncharacterized protein n=1 Tax=Suillus fuscotomentosus TaxID=1912939 RepID=A0AAD4HHE8_9AGAM|nr:uncharacterized protein F5891DRAFT_1193331 [Suillus fuscotomentosus]KAG1896306.1 hypothetical protein F5891DRAFT_1193331 [Suillus fuscotomentosus]
MRTSIDLLNGFIDITTGLPVAAVATPSRLSPHEHVKSVVKILREGRMSILDFILRILDPSQPDFMYNRDWIYNPSKVEKENSGDGQRSGFILTAVAYISLTVSNEMDAVKEALHGTLDSVTLQFLSMWDLSTTIQDKVTLKAPILHSENVIRSRYPENPLLIQIQTQFYQSVYRRFASSSAKVAQADKASANAVSLV